MKKLVLITGGAGFIGSHTADAFAKKGFRIRILDNLQEEVHAGKWPRAVQKKGYELVKGDVRDAAAWKKALRGAEYVYHAAAYQDQRLDFSRFVTTNTLSTSFLYELIVSQKLPIKKVLIASSQFVYGDGEYRCTHGKKETFRAELRTWERLLLGKWDIICPHGKPAEPIPFKESQPVFPTNSYGLSKHAAEEISLRLGKTYEIPTTVLRYSIVQGARQSPRNIYSGALRIFVSQALAGVPLTVYEDGLETRDFVNVHDVVAANVLALTSVRTNYEIFNVGSSKAYRVIDFAKTVKRLTGSPSEILIGEFRRTDTRHAVSDVRKLKSLNWQPRFTPEDSVREYLKWFREEGFDKKIDKSGLIKLRYGIKN